MKCLNCGYEFDKPNLKSCPLCGFRIIPGTQSPDNKTVNEERPTVSPQSSSIDNETEGTVDLQIPDEELTFEESEVYIEPQPVIPEPPVISRQDSATEPVAPTVYTGQPVASPDPVSSRAPKVNKHREERITPEDPDEYLENGSYQPYPDETKDDTSYDDDLYSRQGEKNSSSWVAIVIAAIGGVLIGSLLYFSI